MSRNQWIATVVLSLMIAFVSGSLAGYLFICLTGAFPPQALYPVEPGSTATPPALDTPTAVRTSTPIALTEAPTPTDTRFVPPTTYTLPPGPTIIPPGPVTPDNWEPDDSLGDASWIQIGETQTHNLHVEGDHDWLCFEAAEGTTYVVETSNLEGDIDTLIYLCDEDEKELVSDDDGGDEFWASRLQWTALEGGMLCVLARDFGDNEGGPGTGYDVSLSLGEAFEIDEYEPDNSRARANAITIGETQNHNLHVEGDRDWVYFEAVAGRTYIIATSNLGHDIDTIVRLYDEQGNELASDDDKGDGFLASHLEWTVEEDSTLYVMVKDLWDSSAGPGTEYRILVSTM